MENNQFHYEYSAPTEAERKEIASIRRKYEPKTESKMEKLRALDKRVKNAASAVGLTVGILGCLVFGLGLTCILEWGKPWIGIPVALVGGVAMSLAYFLHGKTYKKMKKKYAEQIIQLSNDLLNE